MGDLTATVLVGDPVVATDADGRGPQLLTYSLSGDAALFTITSDTGATPETRGGQIAVKAGTKLDKETKSTYMVTVKATDSDGLSASIDVTITVTNVDEAPEIAGDDVTKDYPENGRAQAQVARFTATDPEGRTVYWSLDARVLLMTVGRAMNGGVGILTADGADAAHFSISSQRCAQLQVLPRLRDADGGGLSPAPTQHLQGGSGGLR